MSAPPEYPTAWQKKTLWMAFTTLAVVTIGAIAVGLIWLVSQVLGFLQPILVPFAIAGVLAYLLNPIVTRITSWGTSRHRAVVSVFAVVSIVLAGILVWILPALSTQSINLARKIPGYTKQVRARVLQGATVMHNKFGIDLIPMTAPKLPVETAPAPATTPAVASSSVSPDEEAPEKVPSQITSKITPGAVFTSGTADIPPAPTGDAAIKEPTYDLQQLISGDWLQASVREALGSLIRSIRHSLGGFLGIIGFIVSLIIVPIYLYYFLTEGPTIEREWSNYLPLRASAFKDEVVSTLNEINGYLIAFFRGQLVVSLINGTVTGVCLVIAGLEFGLLIGLSLCVVGIIPYLGIAMCWIAAVVIASVQGGSWCVVGQEWYVFPLLISAIFIVVHNFDGFFITPKIVGESVGLHPATVIFSVFAWSLLMGGLLGAILAVPMTATLKVLLRRYVWERRFRPLEPALAPVLPPVETSITALETQPATPPLPAESAVTP